KHSHGGTVTSASTIAATASKGIAHNKQVTCPIHRDNHIADDDDTVVIEGAG
ncbi:hypothetical protein SAMN05444172_0001, partial [Burkholderia sp. GAS332]